MKVKAVLKIEILDGEEKGKIDTFSTVEETDTTYTEYGIIDHLRLEWKHIHDVHLSDEKESEVNE